MLRGGEENKVVELGLLKRYVGCSMIQLFCATLYA